VVLARIPVSTLVKVTVALPTTECEGSRTVPKTSDDSNWANPRDAAAQKASRSLAFLILEI
jgi:hypothetical protein